MNTTHTPVECIPQQIRVFSKWLSHNLTKANSKVNVTDITKGLKNSSALIELKKVLVGESTEVKLNASSSQSDVKNIDIAIDILNTEGVHLKGFTVEEV